MSITGLKKCYMSNMVEAVTSLLGIHYF